MSAPQVEDGYTRIANELLEALMQFNFSKREYKVILTVMRKTYGYRKKVDMLSQRQISDLTNLDRSDTSKIVRSLIKKNVLYETGKFLVCQGGAIKEIGLNKNPSQWVPMVKTPSLPKRGKTPEKTGQITQNPMGKTPHTKETTKRNTKERARTRFKPPTVDEVKQYCREKSYNVDAEYFIAYYDAVEWMRGKTKIKSWKQTLTTWNCRDKQKQQSDAPTLKKGEYL